VLSFPRGRLRVPPPGRLQANAFITHALVLDVLQVLMLTWQDVFCEEWAYLYCSSVHIYRHRRIIVIGDCS
jgi:hypothetical protein